MTDLESSINLDGTLVQPDSRRWHHSLGNALWHTVRFPVPFLYRLHLGYIAIWINPIFRIRRIISTALNTLYYWPTVTLYVAAAGLISLTRDELTQTFRMTRRRSWRIS